MSFILPLMILVATGCKSPEEKSPFKLEEASISSIKNALTDSSLSCEKLVEMYLTRIEEIDKPSGINSIILVNPHALETARQKDMMIARGDSLPPLHGIPIIVKDNYNTAGLQTTAGSIAMSGFEPNNDAFIIKRLKEAGAIVLAKSNMAEWAFSPMVTISSIAGETRNPYNLNHVPAGSIGF